MADDSGRGAPSGRVALRPVRDDDFDVLFRHQSDPESVRVAAFTSDDPGNRERFDAHLARVLALPDATNRVITVGGEVVGSIARFVMHGRVELTYWVDRAWWGRGIATRALEQFLAETPTRPLHAAAASDNVGSLRVLQRCGFRVVGTDRGFAAGRGVEIEETLLRLD